MSLQSLANKFGVLVSPIWGMPVSESGTTSQALAGVGHKFNIIGRVFLEGGAGSSKTISSAGGKIYWRTATVTFANASTNLRIGIQDIGATGLEDGTFDVRGDLVAGTDTLSSNASTVTAMETGTKTITHGDLIAVAFEMTARGGTDSVAVSSFIRSGSLHAITPYATFATGGASSKIATNIPRITIEFDDGTVGWFGTTFFAPALTSTAFNSGSTPDERALIFQLPFKASISGVTALISSVASTDDFEVILYSDPLGTPVAERTITVDASFTSEDTATCLYEGYFSSAYTVNANTKYAIAIRPTTANSINFQAYTMSDAKLLRPTMLGENWYQGTRTDQTGAFSETTTVLPMIGFFMNQLDDGASAGGLKTHPGMTGGMRG